MKLVLERLHVDSASVLLNHPITIELGHKCDNGAFHHREPSAWETFEIAFIVERHNLLLQNPIERFGIACIDVCRLGALDRTANRKPVCAVIALKPPAIQHREV